MFEHVYKWIDDLNKRLLSVFQSRRDLSGRDCLFLARHAFTAGYYDKALQWAHAALIQANRKGDRWSFSSAHSNLGNLND